MKPLGIKNYGSIPHLSTSKLGDGDHYISEGQERIILYQTRDIHDVVISTEKYDGSNIGIAKVNGKIFALTRSGYEAKTSPYKQHHYFSEWVYKYESVFKSILDDGERLVGEWMMYAHGLKYEISNPDPIVFFDWFLRNNKRMPYAEFYEIISNRWGLKTSRLLNYGNPVSINDLIERLNEKTPEFKSELMPEGIVFRVERKGSVDFLAKWVRSDFIPGRYIIGVDDAHQTKNHIIG
jgi:ATP-dependent RNA circularization protein (DNA/RNA ligase family)